jgi:carbon storage regulator
VLVLSRKAEQSVFLGDDIRVVVLAIEGDRVKIGIDAPRSLSVLRQEIYEQVLAANAAASQAQPAMSAVTAALRGLNHPVKS